MSAGTLDLTVVLTGEAHLDGGEPVDLEATMPLRLGPQNEDDPDAVVRIRTTELHHPLSASSVEVADPADVEGIARQAHAPILCRDDGWQGVVTDDVLYWTPPPVP